MKRQLFSLLHENDMQFKIIKMYVNRFIIDEDAECELIEINQISKAPSMTLGYGFSKHRAFKKIQSIFLYQEELSIYNLFEIATKIHDRFQFRSTEEQKTYQLHFIIGTSVKIDLLFFMITLATNAHCSVLLIRSKNFLTEDDFRSIPQNELRKGHVGDFNVTIGDDIDFFIDKFYDIKSSIDILNYILYLSSLLLNGQIISKFLNQLGRETVFKRDFDYLNSFEESEPSFMDIKCQRKFFPVKFHRNPSFWSFGIIGGATLIILILGPVWYRGILKIILDFVQAYFEPNILISFCLGCMSSFTVIVVHLQCFHYIIEAFQNLTAPLKACMPLLIPKQWVYSANILNLFLFCLNIYSLYKEVVDTIWYSDFLSL